MIKKFLSIYVAGFGTGIIGSILANVIKEQTYFYYKLMLVATLVIVFCLSLKIGLLKNNKNTQEAKNTITHATRSNEN
jgi:cell division protein FtsL